MATSWCKDVSPVCDSSINESICTSKTLEDIVNASGHCGQCLDQVLTLYCCGEEYLAQVGGCDGIIAPKACDSQRESFELCILQSGCD